MGSPNKAVPTAMIVKITLVGVQVLKAARIDRDCPVSSSRHEDVPHVGGREVGGVAAEDMRQGACLPGGQLRISQDRTLLLTNPPLPTKLASVESALENSCFTRRTFALMSALLSGRFSSDT